MKPVVELISAWADYESKYPDASAAEFCSHFLSSHRVSSLPEPVSALPATTTPQRNNSLPLTGTAKSALLLDLGIQESAGHAQIAADTLTVTHLDQQLAHLIGQLNAFHISYSKSALKDVPGVELEWFYFMKAIDQQKEARKSDVVSAVLFEQSTGIDIINRIKKAGLLSERNDPADKRARLIRLTPKGEKLLTALHEHLSGPDQLLFQNLAIAHKKLLINLLGDAELKNRQLLLEKQLLKEKHLPIEKGPQNAEENRSNDTED